MFVLMINAIGCANGWEGIARVEGLWMVGGSSASRQRISSLLNGASSAQSFISNYMKSVAGRSVHRGGRNRTLSRSSLGGEVHEYMKHIQYLFHWEVRS